MGTSFNWFRKQQNEGTVPEFAQLWCGRQAIISNHGTVLFTIRVRRSTSKYGIGWLGFNASFWRSCRSESSEPPRLKFLGALADLAHRLDSTRLVTAALQTSYINPTTITISDPLSRYLDIVSCNEHIGWYDGPPEKIDTIEWRSESDKPFVISEFGADGQAGRHGDSGTIWTEEFQADVYRRQINMFQRIPSLSGTIAWVLMDFRSPRRPLAGI